MNMAVDNKKLIEQFEKMNVLELNEFVKELKEHFNLPDAPVMMAGGAGADAGEEVSSSFDVKITDPGANKMAMIKLIKDMAGLSLGDAKTYVEDAARATLATLLKKEKGYSKPEAEELKGKLEAEGAKVEIVNK